MKDFLFGPAPAWAHLVFGPATSLLAAGLLVWLWDKFEAMKIRCPECDGTGRDGCEANYPYQRKMCNMCMGSGIRHLRAVVFDRASIFSYRWIVGPYYRIRLSRFGCWVARQFRRTCYTSIHVAFKGGFFAFTCHKPRWHKGACQDSVPDWECVVPHKPGQIRYDEVNRRKFNILKH
jgi:hypothetical protein